MSGGSARGSAAVAALIGAALAFASTVALAQETPEPPLAATLTPSDLSPWGMFLSADVFVKTVMASLAFASFAAWTVALVKGIELTIGARRSPRSAWPSPGVGEHDRGGCGARPATGA